MELTTLNYPAALQEAEKAYALPTRFYQRKLFLWILLVLLCCLATITAFYGYVAWKLARPAIFQLQSNPERMFGAAYESVKFPSLNGKSTLSGWYIPSGASKKTIIFSHGYGANREEIWVPIYKLAKAAHRQHYNVLMFDYGYVNSEHRVVTAGVKESGELLGAVDYVKSRGASEVVVWGFSMGAGTALQAALHSDAINAMILDSTFLLDADQLAYNMQRQFHLPVFPTVPMLRMLIPLLDGFQLGQIPDEQVKTTPYPMPIFFIHGQKDIRSPYHIAETIYLHQKNPLSRLWLAPERGHEMIYRFQSKEYLKKTISFLQAVSAHQKR